MSQPGNIRVLVVEDNELTRMGVVTLIRTQADMQVVGEAKNGAEAITLYRSLVPDVVLLDLKMPTMDGVQVTTTLCAEKPAAKILVLSHYDGAEDIFQAVNAGARGYATKEIDGIEILNAVRTIHSGKRYLPAEIAMRLADRMTQPSLSKREKQVLDAVFAGMSNRQIAEHLSLSERTAGLYVSNILAKLGAKSRTEAVAFALERGLLTQK